MSNDQQLVDASRGGDRVAFETLVRQTARLVYSRIYLHTVNRTLSEDLTQETFLQAWKAIHSLRDAAQLRSWLMTIAHRVVVNDARRKLRKKHGGHRIIAASDPDEHPDEIADPHDNAEQSEKRRRVLEALRSMPDEYRQPLELRYFADADYDMIAKQLALSNGSLRGLLHRGLAMLRKRMGEE